MAARGWEEALDLDDSHSAVAEAAWPWPESAHLALSPPSAVLVVVVAGVEEDRALVFTVHDLVVLALHVCWAAPRSPASPFRHWHTCRRGSAFAACVGCAVHGATPSISPVAFGHARPRLPFTFRYRRSDRERRRCPHNILVVANDLIATTDDLLSMHDPHLIGCGVVITGCTSMLHATTTTSVRPVGPVVPGLLSIGILGGRAWGLLHKPPRQPPSAPDALPPASLRLLRTPPLVGL
uniref:Uncharacterized protein n=1 Tax=Oryza sativa subsp. japonica TaxID=39947 RepID=Q75IF3_ORYSJ|nr:hypothetical protein [Oryza sativa Japonica Group]